MSGLTLRDLMRMPWTYEGPREITEDGQTHFELRVQELPDFFVAGESATEVLSELKDALGSFLQSYVDRDEVPQLPLVQHLWQARLIQAGLKPLAAPVAPSRAVIHFMQGQAQAQAVSC